jgi:hypothetical protein
MTCCASSTINWSGRHRLRENEVSQDYPLAPLFDAITLLKTDVDHLLRSAAGGVALREAPTLPHILENIADGYEIDSRDGSLLHDAMLDILGLKRDEVHRLSPGVRT